MAKTRCVCSTSAAVGFMVGWVRAETHQHAVDPMPPPRAFLADLGRGAARTTRLIPSDRLPPSRSPSRVLGFRSLKFLPADIRFTLTGNKANRMIVA